jgi:ribosomal protein L37AE/L43A
MADFTGLTPERVAELMRAAQTTDATQIANERLVYMKIKGKEYAPVSERVRAFRCIYPNGAITTQIISQSETDVTIKATVYDERGSVIATGHATENKNASNINRNGAMLENAETSAVGRALGFLGIGTKNGIATAEEVTKADKIKDAQNKLHVCRRCGREIVDTKVTTGEIWKAEDIAKMTLERTGDTYCLFCLAEINKAGEAFGV